MTTQLPIPCACSAGKAECDCGLCGDARPFDDSKFASDFAEWQGDRIQRWDRPVNWFFTLLVVGLALVAVFA